MSLPLDNTVNTMCKKNFKDMSDLDKKLVLTYLCQNHITINDPDMLGYIHKIINDGSEKNKVLQKLYAKVFECENDLKSNEDFLLSDIPAAYNGIKWFIQEWLPNHIGEFK